MNKLLLFLTCLCSTAFSGEEETYNTAAGERKAFSMDSKETLFISLGPDCYISGYLDQIGYRRASFPFDWLLMLDHSGMVKLLNDDFKYFLDPSCYAIHTNRYLVHTYYHLEFRHEHDNDLIGKYARRIDRFRKLDLYPGKIFFIRKSYAGAESPSFYWPSKDLLHISFEDALELKQGLKKRFPNLDHSLVIINFCGGRTTIKIQDDIIMVNADPQTDPLIFLKKLTEMLAAINEFCAIDRIDLE